MARILSLLLAVASFTTLSSALCFPRGQSTPTLPLNEVAPKNTGSAALPTPTVQPKAITLGLGYQNYTCNATSASAGVYIQTGPSDGALAELFDISSFLTNSNIDDISNTTLKAFEKCSSGPDYVGCHYAAITTVTKHPNHIGQHFFAPSNGAQTPHFALDEYNLYIAAKRAGSVAAPSDAYKGKNGLGAIAWLYLVNDGEPYTRGLKSLYRVETAGGVAPSSCTTKQAGSFLSVPYAAQYWFYD